MTCALFGEKDRMLRAGEKGTGAISGRRMRRAAQGMNYGAQFSHPWIDSLSIDVMRAVECAGDYLVVG